MSLMPQTANLRVGEGAPGDGAYLTGGRGLAGAMVYITDHFALVFGCATTKRSWKGRSTPAA